MRQVFYTNVYQSRAFTPETRDHHIFNTLYKRLVQSRQSKTPEAKLRSYVRTSFRYSSAKFSGHRSLVKKNPDRAIQGKIALIDRPLHDMSRFFDFILDTNYPLLSWNYAPPIFTVIISRHSRQENGSLCGVDIIDEAWLIKQIIRNFIAVKTELGYHKKCRAWHYAKSFRQHR